MTKILVVDDDSAINELIKINLELQGYEVVQAFNGTEGFALAKQELPALIVLDVMMPEVDGFTVAKRIRQCENIAEIPIIMLTALSQLNDKVKQDIENKIRDNINYPNQTKAFIEDTCKLLYAKIGIQNPSKDLLDAINYDFKYFDKNALMSFVGISSK